MKYKNKKILLSVLMITALMIALVIPASASVEDDYLGEWVLKKDNFIHYSSSFYVDGVFEFPEIADYVYDSLGITEITRIGFSIEEEEDDYYSGLFWVSTPDIYDDGGYADVCYFRVNVDDWEDPNNGSINWDYCFWVSPEITYFNVVSLSFSDSYNVLRFSEFISVNFERRALPPEPTNIYKSCYDLINTWIFGGEVVKNTYLDLVCITLASASCIFVYALPFVIVWLIIKIWL